MNVATGDNTYVDPSALTRLYIHQAGSRDMSVWRAKSAEPVFITHHGHTEIINAIARAAFLGNIDEQGFNGALHDLESDFVEGRLRQADVLWRSALDRAGTLSQKYTPKLGARTLDVLHVACALELKLRHFLTFDERQQQLAAKVGLKIVRL
jgi:predicted nucleic acid-binding protein